MLHSKISTLFPFLCLLFFGTICSSMIIPFMGFFLVESLGHPRWILGVYSILAVSLTLIANRQFARRIDAGNRVFPLVGLAAAGYAIAALSVAVSPNLWTVLTLGVLGFGVSSSAISTMFSLGGSLAERNGIDRSLFNAYMRATTSTAWMLGPALAFLVADQINARAVFIMGLGAATIWISLWWFGLPRDISAAPKTNGQPNEDGASATRSLWMAAAFVFCLSSAHSLTFTALPLFYVQEVNLPGFAPGIAFSVKTFVEVFAIFATPFIIARIGIYKALLATTVIAIIAIQVLASVQSFQQMLAGAALEGVYYGFFASLGISYVQSFAQHRPAQATAIYWNTLMVSGLLAGPAVGFIAQVYDFQTVIVIASYVALFSGIVLIMGMKLQRDRT